MLAGESNGRRRESVSARFFSISDRGRVPVATQVNRDLPVVLPFIGLSGGYFGEGSFFFLRYRRT